MTSPQLTVNEIVAGSIFTVAFLFLNVGALLLLSTSLVIFALGPFLTIPFAGLDPVTSMMAYSVIFGILQTIIVGLAADDRVGKVVPTALVWVLFSGFLYFLRLLAPAVFIVELVVVVLASQIASIIHGLISK